MDTVWKDKFYMAFRLCPFIMTIHSFPDMRVLDVNDAYERSTGFTRGEVVGRTMFEIGLWSDREAMTRASDKLKKEGKIAESARGISPRAAHRSGRETLASSGSCHPIDYCII